MRNKETGLSMKQLINKRNGYLMKLFLYLSEGINVREATSTIIARRR